MVLLLCLWRDYFTVYLDLPLMEDILEETQSIKHSPETVDEAINERPQLDSPNSLFPIPTGESQGSTVYSNTVDTVDNRT